MKSVFDSVKTKLAIAPIAQGASAATGVVIDTLGFNSAMVHVSVGAATGTPDSYSVACKVQECATSGGSYADISGATASLVADGTSAQIRIEGLNGTRARYIKVIMTPAFVNGTSPKALIGATAVLGNAQNKPVGNSSTPA